VKLTQILPREAPAWLTLPVARALAAVGVSPNLVSAVGFVGNCGAAALVATGHFWQGGVLVLAFSILDIFDGALARLTGKATPFGAVFDAVLDRASEAAVLLGIVIYYTEEGAGGGDLEVIAAFAALTGSVMVSYVRARAEGSGILIREGLFTRFERVVVLAAGLILDQVLVALVILAVLANLTAVQRLWAVHRATALEDG
jgi:phosphatidylglycerophosphate synthase